MDEGTLGAGRGASEKDVEVAVNGLPKDDLLKFVQAFGGIDALWLKLMPRGGRESWMDDYRMAATLYERKGLLGFKGFRKAMALSVARNALPEFRGFLLWLCGGAGSCGSGAELAEAGRARLCRMGYDAGRANPLEAVLFGDGGVAGS